jgi:DNA-binding HxlR family transcriptional regulator
VENTTKKKSNAGPIESKISVHEMVESIIGCKWSLHVLSQVRSGANRPGKMVQSTPGLTTKVLNERLAKMVRFGILVKVSHAEVPPRVEYHFTPFGLQFSKLLDEVDSLQRMLGACDSR